MTELLPCPFCAGPARLKQGCPGSWFVQCECCMAASNDVGYEHAIDIWNKRGLPQSPMIKGAIYELNGRGPAEYVGLDIFHGETTHKFNLNGRPYYVLPENLVLAVSRPVRSKGE